ncbi:MAG: toxic anion resistance protein [Lachnospiraceae bacterium]|nr:toxic anion resistance protein [Lachnospiraceae bacterium]
MAIVVEKTNQMNATNSLASGCKNTVVLAKDLNTAIVETKQNDVMVMTNWRDNRKMELVKSGELDRLTSLINVNEPQSIIVFGKEPAMELSKCSDEVIRKYDSTQLVETTKLMTSITKIMDQIDVREIEKDETGLFGFVKKFKHNTLDKLVNKYNTIGANLESICVELTKHDRALMDQSTDIDKLHDAYVELYHRLCDYIIAGDQAIEEVNEYVTSLSAQVNNGDTSADTQMILNSVNQAKLQLEQRVQELRTVETIALQSIPVLESYKFNNLNLSRKINSAFIITIPAFKGAISQAILQKQQRLTAEGLEKFDQKTNEMLLRNSENARDNMVKITQLSTQQSIKTETLQQSWSNIMDGVNQVNDLIKTMSSNIETEKHAIEAMNSNYITQIRGK